MRNAVVLVLCALLANSSSAQEPVAKSKIVSVGIFKNGLTIVKREVQIPEAGSYRLDAAPQPVHGTFWIESNCKVESAVKTREFDVPFYAGTKRGLQEQLAGKKVVLHLKDMEAPVIGVMAKIIPARERREEGEAPQAPAPTANFLVLKTAKGHTYVNPEDIISLDAEGKDETVKQRRPTLVLTVEKAEQKPVVFVSYLTHGLGWAPSYLVDITDPKKLSIEMAAAIRNELADLDEAEVKLISGFPSVQFAHVPSPLSPRTTWDKFLAALNRPEPGAGSVWAAQPYTTNPMTNYDSNTFVPSPKSRDLGATPSGEGVDLHFEPIGKRSLLDGETLSLTVAKAKVDYERIVEWTAGREQSSDEATAEDIWDVLHFRNPFTFPMTTAPAMVTEKGQFNGQRACYWANVGEETSLRITRSLSVRARGLEQVEKVKADAGPETVKIGAAFYRKVAVQGELTVNNHRKQAIKMRIRRAVTGTILSTEGEPKALPREDLHAVNPVQDLVWTLNLAPGEEKMVRYRYSVLVVVH